MDILCVRQGQYLGFLNAMRSTTAVNDMHQDCPDINDSKDEDMYDFVGGCSLGDGHPHKTPPTHPLNRVDRLERVGCLGGIGLGIGRAHLHLLRLRSCLGGCRLLHRSRHDNGSLLPGIRLLDNVGLLIPVLISILARCTLITPCICTACRAILTLQVELSPQLPARTAPDEAL